MTDAGLIEADAQRKEALKAAIKSGFLTGNKSKFFLKGGSNLFVLFSGKVRGQPKALRVIQVSAIVHEGRPSRQITEMFAPEQGWGFETVLHADPSVREIPYEAALRWLRP